MKKNHVRLVLPIVVLVVMGVFLYIGLSKDPRKLPSVLIGKAVPSFNLKLMLPPTVWPVAEPLKIAGLNGMQTVGPDQFKGQPWVLNVFASWCQACLIEHPHLLEMARQGKIRLIGLAYKDQEADTLNWLAKHGNPYQMVIVDRDGLTGIDLGVYGVPETFLMSADNTIIHKHVGPITANSQSELLAKASSSVQGKSLEVSK